MIKLNNWIYDLEQVYDRKLLKGDINDLAYESEIDHEVIIEIVDVAEEAIDKQDERALLDSDLWELNITIEQIDIDELVTTALRSAGYKVEESNVSNSLYAINDNGEELRISDHERPAVVEGNVAVGEHEQGLVFKSIEVPTNTLIRAGFANLEKNKTLYLWKN